MRKISHLYFLHIPKTSGIKMQYEILNASKSIYSKNSPNAYIQDIEKEKYPFDEFEFVFNPEIADSYNIICGHFARNPISAISNIATFSMVREPFSQYLSLAKYAAMQSDVDFTEGFLDSFLNNDNDTNSKFEGMSGCENPQSCFLYSKIACIEAIPHSELNENISKSENRYFL